MEWWKDNSTHFNFSTAWKRVRRLHHPVALLLRTAAPSIYRIGRWVGQQPICTLKFTQEQITKVQRASRGITTLSVTSVLERVGGQCHAPAALPPRGRLSGSQGRSRRMQNISPPPPGFDPWTDQPAACGYTDCAIPAHAGLNTVHHTQTLLPSAGSPTTSLAILNRLYYRRCGEDYVYADLRMDSNGYNK
jgi:hypothetical protein